jgi:aminobenzoyl-glutamate utilization protein B
MRSSLLLSLLALAPGTFAATKEDVVRFLDERSSNFSEVAREIWELAEVGYQEEKSAALLKLQLQNAGFRVASGVAGMPTSFVGSYGEGRPIIAFLAEFDALPGLSQDAVAERKPIVDSAPGHGCGHHLFGTAATAAAIGVATWLESSGTPGTIRLYGTPAEEGGAGKVYMVRAGLFDDVDAVLTWHPSDRNDASPVQSLANKSAKFRFHGLSAHAAAAPEQGRSALDGVEAMNYMVNMMREHVPEKARIHYVITRGGLAPNVVPDFAEVYYYVRHPDVTVVQELFARVVKAAEGAAAGTETTMDYEVIHGIYSKLPNETLHALLDENFRKLPGIEYGADERAFAEKLRTTLQKPDLPLGSESEVQPFEPKVTSASTDVGDISWVVPTASLFAATWVPGTPAHSWQAVAAGGMSIGFKGMTLASKVLATTAIDLLQDPARLAKARSELEKERGPDFVYVPLVGDRDPPLDYRK